MQVTYRFTKVDPRTWRDAEEIAEVEDAEVSFDSSQATKGTMTCTMSEPIGEAYIRAYIVEDGASSPVGTFLCQTQTSDHDGRTKRYRVEAYTPLHELAETHPPIGFFAPKNTPIASFAARYADDNCRAPVVASLSGGASTDIYVAETDESWLDFLSGLLEQDGKSFVPDYDGSLLIVPDRDAASLQPMCAFTDDNASIVQGEVEEEWDVYKVPNRVTVIAPDGTVAVAENRNDDTPLSYNNRGRWVEERITDPKLPIGYDQSYLDDYAERELAKRSVSEHKVTITHGWVPHLRIGDCVFLALARAGIYTRAIIVSMRLKCDKEAQVQTVLKFTEVMT